MNTFKQPARSITFKYISIILRSSPFPKKSKIFIKSFIHQNKYSTLRDINYPNNIIKQKNKMEETEKRVTTCPECKGKLSSDGTPIEEKVII